MTIVFYISAHGFGHATRTLETIEAIERRAPGTRIVIRSGLSAGFVRRSSAARYELQPVDVDTGVVQHDSLSIDYVETARRAAAFYADFDRRITSEAAHLTNVAADLVVGDIPPLAFAAAAAAGIPSIAVGNFTWDWIYERSPGFEAHAPAVLPRIREAYAHAGTVLRLPFHGGFAAMSRNIRDLPLIARRSALTREQARRTFALNNPDARPIVL